VAHDRELHKRIIRMIRDADIGIDDVRVNEVRWEDLPEPVKRTVLKIGADESDAGDHVSAVTLKTVHRSVGSEAPVEFDLQADESNGTLRFFALVGPLLDALSLGSVVVVDEMECSMHPLLTRKLIELFQSPEVNKKGAQLIFATHDSTLMDPELFRRDQIWLVEKNREGASELFSLYDFDTKDRPRTTTAFQRNYLAGRYGGVPDFGPAFEDLELK